MSTTGDLAAYRSDYGRSLDEDELAEVAAEEAPQSYADAGTPYDCIEDCSGHEAGYAWALENGVTDASECSGQSASFEEGCSAYAEALAATAEDLTQ